MFDAIETTDWAAIPGFTKFYAPEVIAPALRALSRSESTVQAADAASDLFGAGLLHDHSGMVHPAAVTAAPILLDIIEHAHPATRPAAIGLLDDAMSNYPYEGFNTVDTDYAAAVPLCCAIARQVRARRPVLAALGDPGKNLLAIADEHWRMIISDATTVDGPATLVIGPLDGTLPTDPTPADLRIRRDMILLREVRGEYHNADDGEAAVTILEWIAHDGIPPGSILASPCSDRLH